MVVNTVEVEEYGPKYSAPSGSLFRVMVILGYHDFMPILMYG